MESIGMNDTTGEADTNRPLFQWLGQGSNHLTLQHLCKDRDTGYVLPSFQSPQPHITSNVGVPPICHHTNSDLFGNHDWYNFVGGQDDARIVRAGWH